MMRLTEIKRDRLWITLRVEGWITSKDCPLLESECTSLLGEGKRLRLECTGVTYLDSLGAGTLRALRRRRVEIVGLPQFVVEFVGQAPG